MMAGFLLGAVMRIITDEENAYNAAVARRIGVSQIWIDSCPSLRFGSDKLASLRKAPRSDNSRTCTTQVDIQTTEK